MSKIKFEEIKKLSKDIEDLTGFKCFILDPNSMSLAEQEEELRKAQEFANTFECDNCKNKLQIGSSLCNNCGKTF